MAFSLQAVVRPNIWELEALHVTVRAAHLQHELIYLPCVGQSHTAATVQSTAAARAAEREAEESRRAGK